jgi:hypothetical protein
MSEDTKQLLIIAIAILLLFGMFFTWGSIEHYLNNQALNCQNVSRYNNTLQHDINLETVCK